MAGDATAEAKRKWLHEALDMPVSSLSGGIGNDTDLMDPNAPDTDPADDEVTEAAAEVDSAGKDVVAKQQTEQEAEKALAKAQSDLDAAKSNLAEKTEKYYEAQVTAQGPGSLGAGSDLPAPMLPDCVSESGKIAGPPEHQLCKTHGHVLNTQSKQIIAHSVQEYDERHPVPRPMASDCQPDPGKLPNAPDHVVMCKPHGHVLDIKAKQIIANSGILYLKAHPDAAAKPKVKPDAVTGASAPPAGKGAAVADAGKTGKAPAQPGAMGAEAPGATAKAAKPRNPDGDWKVSVEKWKELSNINIDVALRGMRDVAYTVYWQYGSPSVMPPPMAHVELTFTNGLTSKQLAAAKGPAQMITAGGRYDFSDRFALPADEAAKKSLGLFIRCRIVLEGTESDELEHTGVITIE